MELSKALRRSDEIGRLTAAICDALPPDMGSAVLAASVDAAGTLTVKAISSAWASRLRFESEQLTAAAATAGIKVDSVRVRVGRSNQA